MERGDKVVITSDNYVGEFQGKIGTITYISKDLIFYEISVDDTYITAVDGMFRPLTKLDKALK